MPLDSASAPAAAMDRTVSGLERVAEALRMAEIRLMQAEDIDRIGYLRDSFTQDAAAYLRAAGRSDLAERLDDDPWGDEAVSALAEVTRAREVG